MPRRKKVQESKDDDEEPAVENGPPAAAPATPQGGVPGISPPGMRLRSGRKKKRRRGASDDDSMTTDDDDEAEKPPAKRRATRSRKNKASKSDDESMTDASVDDDESMDDDAKPKGQNGYKARSVAALPTVQETEEAQEEAAAAAPTNGRLGPISKLRMPSKHTPGKLETTAPAPGRAAGESRRLQFGAPTNVLNEVPPVAAAAAAGGVSTTTATQQQQQQEPVESPQGIANAELNAILVEGTQEPPVQQQQQVSFTAHWYQVATTSLGTMVYTISEVATSLVVPEQYVEEEEDIEVTVSSPLLTRLYVWFILLLLLQLVCWNPIVTTVQETSDRSLQFYKSLLGTKEESTVDKDVVEKPTVAGSQSRNEEEKLKDLDTLSQLLESFNKGATVDSEMDYVEKELVKIRGRTRERQQALEDWHDGLDDVESALKGLATAKSMDDVPRLFFRANEILGFFKDMVPPDLATEILDTTYVFLWETSATGTCTQPTAASDDPLLTPEKLQMGEKELRQMSLASASEIMSDEEVSRTLRAWIREAVPKNATSQTKEESKPKNGLAKGMVRDIISNFLEEQRADQLGVVDYASISAGSSVIRVGKRATTPSLVDTLPLWNRLVEHAGLRFYGYGPEAALTPTFPVNALGQCWAFESHPKKKGGRYATLTVELGKPIYVSSVVIEHAPKELTDQLQTAIQSFRILGYEDADATTERWHLGSFQYDIDAPRTLQEFEVANHVESELIPKLRSITLAIDSNWGFSYSCLYRFRVQGGDEPSDIVIEGIVDGETDEDYIDSADGNGDGGVEEEESDDRHVDDGHVGEEMNHEDVDEHVEEEVVAEENDFDDDVDDGHRWDQHSENEEEDDSSDDDSGDQASGDDSGDDGDSRDNDHDSEDD